MMPSVTPEQRQREIARIQAAMIKQAYYVIHRESIDPTLKEAVLLEHYYWLIELEKRGDILLSGAIVQKDGTRSEGLSILRADSFEAAEALAASDPAVANGATSFRIERLVLGAGRFTVSVDFSDGAYKID